MRIVVFGASGRLGTSTVSALLADRRVTRVVGVSRRPPATGLEWHRADVTRDPLEPILRGADAAVHLAFTAGGWRDRAYAANVLGSDRILEAVAAAQVKALVYLSSFAAYSPAPPGTRVDEEWPTHGIGSSSYSRQRAYVERLLDRFELLHPIVRTVRLRPGLSVTRPPTPVGRILARVVPDVPGLAVHAVHPDDVGQAVRLAVTGSVTGAFNVAADPEVTPASLAAELGAVLVPTSPRVLRLAHPGWVDLAMGSPLLDTTRARTSLRWSPVHSGLEAVRELVTV